MRTFSRGPGPLVSILFPTRGRPEGLCKAVDSLWSLARDKSLIEFIFKADTDDCSAIQTITFMGKAGLPVSGIVSPRGRGYHDMHHWVNAMAQKARGDWLIIWNDDAVMKTQDWDQILLGCSPDSFIWHGVEDVICLVAKTINHPGASGFFFLRRKVVEILGQFSRIPHNDTWVTTLMRSVDSLYNIDAIGIEHLSESKDATWNEGIEARQTKEYTTYNPSGRVNKMEDALKLAHYIEEKSRENTR